MKAKMIFWDELTEGQKLVFLEENEEYLTWADGTPIRVEEMSKFSLAYNGQCWNLTLQDSDFYIEDVIFEL